MSFTASNDRILVTGADGSTFFDTNRVMPHFVAEVSNTVSFTYPGARYVGAGSVAIRAPTFQVYRWDEWSQTIALGSVPSGIINPIIYCQIYSTQTIFDEAVESYSDSLLSGVLKTLGTGSYNCFNTLTAEQFWGGTNISGPGWTTQGLYSHKARLLNFFISGNTLYMEARQASKNIAGRGGVNPASGSGLTLAQWFPAYTQAGFTLNITAYIGSMS